MKILVTGACGFIGSNFVKSILSKEKDIQFVLLDALTYAGHYPNIEKDLKENKHLRFIKGDIRQEQFIDKLFKEENFSSVLHFAAESHVDRSIENPNIFFETNALGTLNLLNASLKTFKDNPNFRYLQVSTDEVYGHLNLEDPAFTEKTPIAPRSPYSASKASADLLVTSFFKTYGLPTIITRCSNNYGPYQFPEKLIPLMIHNASQNISLPVYGKGLNIRDWIHVEDHNRGVWAAFKKGRAGEVYNLGGACEKRNIDLVKSLLSILKKDESLITYVEDRKGHDLRYAMDFSKAKAELGFSPQVTFEEGLKETVDWYLSHPEWIKSVLEKEKL